MREEVSDTAMRRMDGIGGLHKKHHENKVGNGRTRNVKYVDVHKPETAGRNARDRS